MWSVCALLVAQAGGEILAGDVKYRLTDAVYLAPFGSLAAFSPSGDSVAFLSNNESDNLIRLRERIAKNDQAPKPKAVIRFNTRNGRREVLRQVLATETISNIVHVGPKGDVLFDVELDSAEISSY